MDYRVDSYLDQEDLAVQHDQMRYMEEGTMGEEQQAALEMITAIPEAPASASVRFQLEGFEWLFTVRNFSDKEPGRELLTKVKGVNEAIVKMGGAPIYGKNANQERSAIGSKAPEEDDPSWCPVHNLKMTKYEKEGRSWYSHQVDGEWCRGK